MPIPIAAFLVAHVHIADVILAKSHKKVVADNYTCHGAQEDTPTAEDSDKSSRIDDVVPGTNGDCNDGENVASTANVDPPDLCQAFHIKVGRFRGSSTHFGHNAAMSIPVDTPFSI